MRSKVLSQKDLNLTSTTRSLVYYVTVVLTAQYMFRFFRTSPRRRNTSIFRQNQNKRSVLPVPGTQTEHKTGISCLVAGEKNWNTKTVDWSGTNLVYHAYAGTFWAFRICLHNPDKMGNDYILVQRNLPITEMGMKFPFHAGSVSEVL
jgi:hypothetical protein